MKVVPSDNDAVYYYDVLSKQILDQHHSGDLAVYMKNMMAEAVKNYGSVEEALKKLGSQGDRTMHSRGWIRIPITWLLLRGSMLRAK